MPRSLLLISIAVALSLLGDQMLYAVLPVTHDAMGVPVTAVGLLLSANRWVRLLTNTLAARTITRCGREWPFILALLLGSATTITYGVVHGVGVFLVARLLWGTAWSFIRMEGLSTVLDVASEQTRGRYMGCYLSVSRLGSAVATLMGGILTDLIGFRATFLLFGALTGAAALLAYYEMGQRHKQGLAQHVDTTATVVTVPESAPPVQDPVGQLGGHTWWPMAVASFGTFSSFLVIGGLGSATLGYMLRSRFGATPALGPLLIGVASLTGFLLSCRGFLDLGFAPIAGHLADRWGRYRLIIMAMLLAFLTMLAFALQPPLPVVIALVTLMFTAGTTLQVAFDAVAGDITPPGKRRSFLSLFVTWQDLGAATGPLLGYGIAPQVGLTWLYLIGAGLLLVAMLLYLATFRPRTAQSLSTRVSSRS